VPIDDLETKQVIIAALAGVFGVALLSIVGHFEGTFSFGESAYQIADYAVPAALVSLGAATVVSGRELGNMETWEQGAVGVALLTIGSSKYVPEVETFLMENAPYATLGAVAVSFVAYYILAWRD
jgi:drug/metabolite transporter (DMT)-like permease